MHTTFIKIRGYHLDMYQHVNNARYLELLEEARWDYIEDKLDLNQWMKEGLGFAVANININYRRPATFNQILEIKSHLSQINSKSAVISQQIFLKGTDVLIGDAKVTFVITDMKTGKALPVEGKIKESLQKL